MSTVDCHTWFRNFMHDLKLIESVNSFKKRVRRFQANDPFDLFVAEDKHEIDIIKFVDILTKYL